jgi:type II secretory pathway pseudopilin PulG
MGTLRAARPSLIPIFRPARFARGSSTLELLIALAILTLSLTAVLLVFSSNQAVAVDTQTSDEALGLAQAQLEAARARSRQDFALVNPTVSTTTSGIEYVQTLAVGQVDFFTKQATSTASWEVGGRTLSVLLSTLFTNPSAIHGGDTCSSVLEGDWANPQIDSYEFGNDILGDTSSGFPITSIQTFDHKLYVTVNNTNGNNPDSFFVLDISDPATKPTVIGRTDNAPVLPGLNAVAVDGDGRAFVANAYDANFSNCSEADNCAQLQVIDVSVPATPSVIHDFKLATSSNPYVYAGGGSGQAVGKSIAYAGHYVYLGLSTTVNGPGLHIIDVSNPLSPQWVGSWPAPSAAFGPSGAPINAIMIRGHYAYLAHPKGLIDETGSPNDEELTVLDISDPTDPKRVSGFDWEGGIGGNGKSLYAVGPTLYLGRTASKIGGGNPDTIPELFILDGSDPTAIPQASYKGALPLANNESVNGLIVRDYLAFLIESDKLQTYRIDTPSNITQYAPDLTLPPGVGGGQQGTPSDCEGNYIFIGSLSSNDKGYISVVTGG